MRACGHCQAVNTDDSKFCQQCGQSLEAAAPPPDTTVRWTGPPLPVKSLRRTIPLPTFFGTKNTPLLIGRAPECEVCLPHPSISRHHALMSWGPAGVRLEDLASLNGVLVN